ncbi:hypothetical protein [Kalamiella sp. sgz302252]|uniref:hypothetical protein n=1 Tax=Pantoea sp. sgz302252 TaxID=3341827 RepID=UPI0036D24F88
MSDIPLDNYADDFLLPLDVNAAFQQHAVDLMHMYQAQPLPANFTHFFGAGPRLTADFPALSARLNPHGLNQNCYFCTVAALTNKTVLELVEHTETMQQDGATLDEITQLFRDSGIESFLISDDAASSSPQQLWQRTWHYLNQELSPCEALGLAWQRPRAFNQQDVFSPGGGHMVVVAKDESGTIAALDYQSGTLAALSEMQPPEYVYQQSYHVFQRVGATVLAQWSQAWDFIMGQYARGRSDKGVAAVIQNGQLNCFFWQITPHNTLWAGINGQPTQLLREDDPRGDQTDPHALWRIWPAK